MNENLERLAKKAALADINDKRRARGSKPLRQVTQLYWSCYRKYWVAQASR